MIKSYNSNRIWDYIKFMQIHSVKTTGTVMSRSVPKENIMCHTECLEYYDFKELRPVYA